MPHSKEIQNRRRPHRYFIATALPACLVLLLGLSYLDNLRNDINFTRAEVSATEDLERIFESGRLLQQIRGLHYLRLRRFNISPERIARLQKKLDTMLVYDKSAYPHQKNLKSSLRFLRRKNALLYKQAMHSSARDAELIFTDYSKIVSEHYFLFRQLARDSNLILDPNLTTYTLMHLTIQTLPQLSNHAGMFRARGSSWTPRGLTGHQKITLSFLGASIQEEIHLAREEMNVLRRKNIPLKSSATLHEFERRLRVYRERLKGEQGPRTAVSLFQEGIRVNDSLMGIYRESARKLRSLLIERLKGRQSEFAISFAGTLIALLLMIYFIYSYYAQNKRAFEFEQNARRELDRFKTTLDETMDCVFMFHPDTLEFFYVNKGAMEQVGYDFEELTRMTPIDIKTRLSKEEFQKILAPLRMGETESVQFETVHEHKDGRLIPVDIFLQYIHPAGEPARFVVFARDITERKRVDQLKTDFISTVSHELRTPLTSIRGSLGLIRGGAVGEFPPEAGEMLKIAENNTERLLLLINDILDIQKIEAGEMQFKFQSLDLTELTERALKDNETYGREYAVHFKLLPAEGEFPIYGDPDRLSQVLANLLSNAAKYSPEGDEVEVSISRHNDSLRVSVTDHGPGIPEEFQPRLFQKFSQMDSSSTRKKGGTGLGLSIARAIVEKHGGRIGCLSREGIGTTFYVDFPALIGEYQAKTATKLPEFNLSEHAPCVLIVEDDPDIAALLRRMLAEAGFDSDTAHTVSQARRLLAENKDRYRLISLDLLLPEEDGFSFLESLKTDEDLRKIPVIIVSIKADEARRNIQGGVVNIIDWLQKPIDQTRLLEAVRLATGGTEKPRLLHVEDESDMNSIVTAALHEEVCKTCEVVWAPTLEAARDQLSQSRFDLVLLDIALPDGSGLQLLSEIESMSEQPRVVIFSAYEVSQEIASRVNATLVKSRTDNRELVRTILRAMN